MLAPLLLSILIPQVQVDGLRLEESFLVAPARPERSGVWLQTRLLDAATGEPVQGAVLEAMTEQYRHLGTIIGTACSGRDGSVDLRVRRGKTEAHKIRVHAPGYRSTTWHYHPRLWEGYGLLFPVGESVRIRLRDLDGNPIPGATIESHQTCNHDPPAISGQTDAKGEVVFPDPPAFADYGDLKVLAPGHASLGSVWRKRLLPVPGYEDADTLYLPRRRPIRMRLVHPDGSWVRNRRVVEGGSPEYQEAWTDQYGLLTLDTLFFRRSFYLYFGDGHPDDLPVHISGARASALFADQPLTIMVAESGYAAEFEEGEPEDAALLRIRLPESSQDCSVRAHHETGWLARDAGEHLLPDGEVTVVVGQAFSGFAEQVEVIELEAGREYELSFEPVREPVLTVLGPDYDYGLLHVQAGEDSITIDEPFDDGEAVVPVPAGVPITLLSEIEGEARLIRLPAVTEDQVVDMRGPEAILRRSLEKDWEQGLVPAVELSFRFLDTAGAPVEVRRQELDSVGIEVKDLDPSATTTLIRLPAGAPYEVLFRAPGYLPRWIQGRTSVDCVATRVDVVFRATAKLVVRLPDGETEIFEPLAPGPRLQEVTLPSGERLVLELMLAEGEHRVLTVAAGD